MCHLIYELINTFFVDDKLICINFYKQMQINEYYFHKIYIFFNLLAFISDQRAYRLSIICLSYDIIIYNIVFFKRVRYKKMANIHCIIGTSFI